MDAPTSSWHDVSIGYSHERGGGCSNTLFEMPNPRVFSYSDGTGEVCMIQDNPQVHTVRFIRLCEIVAREENLEDLYEILGNNFSCNDTRICETPPDHVLVSVPRFLEVLELHLKDYSEELWVYDVVDVLREFESADVFVDLE